ncbi:hypothetical protein [Veillonella magna]|uniref:hypothetical protein n=1 Tax=Veillonella magna TaxID=464322 RepID=UPI0023EFEB7B|nr:hypothetical protein [Veillonella magna]
MSKWQKLTLTNKGAALLAKITESNGTLEVTRIAFGSGKPSNLQTATGLASQIDNAQIISKVQKDNTCTVTFRFSNEKFTQQYSISEFGVFANDPSNGEILFAVSTDSIPDVIQEASKSSIVTKTIVIGIGYSNANNVSLTLSNIMWITAEEAQDIAQDRVDAFAAKEYTLIDSETAENVGATFPHKMNQLANRIKLITGKSSWSMAPSINLEQAVKSITRSGDTLTVTTGNGGKTSFSIDNIASANSINLMNNTDILIDASGATPSTVRIGYSAYNYSGAGIGTYEYYNWKGSLANVKANRFIGSLQGTADYANYATTMASSDNSTRIATTSYVQTKKSEIINGAPANLNTLDALAAAIGDDANYSKTIANKLNLKANIESPTFTGTPTAPTPAASDNTTKLATTAFVKTAISPLATTTYVNQYVSNAVSPKADTTYVNTKTNDKFASVSASNATLTFRNGAGGIQSVTVNNVGYSSETGLARKLEGIYTGNGGKQGPSYFGRGAVGALMSNEAINGDSTYKDWLVMDTYTSTDAGGATAFGISRSNGRAFIMQSDSTRNAWNNKTEIVTVKGGQTVDGSMTFTGTVTGNNGIIVPTRPTADNNTYVANTAFVKNVIAPLASTTYVNNAVSPKAPLASPVFTGAPMAPTPSTGDKSKKIATTEFIQNIIASLRAANIIDFKQAAQAAAREQILGDVSNANSWWIGFPSSVGTFCIQGRYFENVPIGSYWIFPVKFRNIFIVTGNDVNGKNYRGATQILTFSDYSLEKVKLGATLIDRDADSFYGRIVAFGLI